MREVVITALLATASAALAQPGTGGTITHNNASFTQGDVPTTLTSDGPLADFRVGGAGNPDHMFQSWWWGRIASDPREGAGNTASSANWSGSQGLLTFDWGAPYGQLVTTYQVIGFGGGGALIESAKFINSTANPVTWNVFHYLDLDLGGTASGDSAVLNGPSQIRITDGPWVADYEGSGQYEVGAFATVRALLTDTDIDNFTNTGLPFAAGDWTGGWQWTFTLNPGDSLTLTTSVTIIPAPASAGVLALGGLLAMRRRR